MRKHLPRTEIESPLDKFAVAGGKIDNAQSAVRFTIAFLCHRTWWREQCFSAFLFVSFLITSTRLSAPHRRQCLCASWF